MIITTGRTDISKFFELSGYLEMKELSHYPILVFLENGTGIVKVEIVDSYKRLVQNYQPQVQCMAQWGGNWSSDFFQFTVKDVADYLAKNNE